MEEVIEKMKTLILAETSEEGYSQEILDAMRIDDVHYFETLGK